GLIAERVFLSGFWFRASHTLGGISAVQGQSSGKTRTAVEDAGPVACRGLSRGRSAHSRGVFYIEVRAAVPCAILSESFPDVYRASVGAYSVLPVEGVHAAEARWKGGARSEPGVFLDVACFLCIGGDELFPAQSLDFLAGAVAAALDAL